MAPVDVGAFADLEEGVPTVLTIGRREIVLVRWDEGIYALRNICPHQSQSFCGGTVARRLAGGRSLGDLVVHADEPVLACPWHFWRFELRSGVCVADPSVRVATYDVSVRSGRIMLDVEARRAPASTHPDSPAGRSRNDGLRN